MTPDEIPAVDRLVTDVFISKRAPANQVPIRRNRWAVHADTINRCEPKAPQGSFTWEHTWDETIYLIEGQIQTTGETGSTTESVPGHLIFVSAGLKCTSEITDHVCTAYHFKSET